MEVITDPVAAISALDPVRSRLLAELQVPASASQLAARVGMTRQVVNDHLRKRMTRLRPLAGSARRWAADPRGMREHVPGIDVRS